MSTYVVDTHALVWFLTSDARLSNTAHELLKSPDSRLLIPTLVLSEIKHLASNGRMPVLFDDIVTILVADPRCEICSIDLHTVVASPTSLDIHDSIIVGVALAHSAAIDGVITRDIAITKSGLCKAIW